MTPDDPTPLRAAARALRQLYGIDVPEYRMPLLAAELEQLGGRGGHAHGLQLLLARDPRAWDRVIDAITVPETYFFRHLGHYLLIRRLAEERAARGRAMRVLCAGCSSGEEAWSAAAVLVAARGHACERDRVVGWDVSEKRLGEARDARYREWSVRGGLHGYDAFFRHTESGWEISPALRPIGRFAKVNLIGALPEGEGPFDAILFRNVAIYWDVETAHGVVERLASLLAPEGLLLVGPSDPAGLDPARWEHVIAHGVRYFRATKKDKAKESAPAPPPSFAPSLSLSRPASAVRPLAAAARLLRAPSTMPGSVGIAARSQHGAGREASRDETPRTGVVPRTEARTPVPAPIQAAGALADVKALADAGKYAAALELLRATVGDASVEAKLWEGILLLELGDTSGAIERIRQCVFLAPERASHRRWLAISYRAAGRIEDAEREQRNAEMVRE